MGQRLQYATPLIVHWPEGVDDALAGGLIHQPGHVIDLMATCLDVAGVPYAEGGDEQELVPLEGVSLRPAFEGRSIDRTEALYFEHHLNCAIRDGDWKLVRTGHTKGARVDPWELYDMKGDRTELNDLAAEHPEIVERLRAKWESWADQTQVRPWPGKEEGR